MFWECCAVWAGTQTRYPSAVQTTSAAPRSSLRARRPRRARAASSGTAPTATTRARSAARARQRLAAGDGCTADIRETGPIGCCLAGTAGVTVRFLQWAGPCTLGPGWPRGTLGRNPEGVIGQRESARGRTGTRPVGNEAGRSSRMDGGTGRRGRRDEGPSFKVSASADTGSPPWLARRRRTACSHAG